MEPVHRSRAVRIGAAVVTLTMLAVGFLPLFGGPGYEQALASGLVVPGAAAVASSLDLRRWRAVDVTPLGSVWRGVTIGAAFAALAFATALLHGLRAGFCDLIGGTATFALGPALGAVMGGAWGAVAGEVVRALVAGRLAAVLLGLAMPIASIAVSVGRFYTSPIIFAFDPFVGYFSGTLYDTVVDAGAALVSYRAGSFATLTALALGASVLLRSARGTPFVPPLRGDRPRMVRVILAAAALTVSLGITIAGPWLGHWQTSSTIARDLGGRRAGPRCDVVYPEGLREDQIARLVDDCEGELASVERTLGARGPDRVTAFFFRDAADKKRLMGAGDTYIAKPWRQEVYLQMQSYPHPALGHELAHVVAGAFGEGPFRIAGKMHGWWPNPGLIEGTAVAAAPDDDELTGTQWARAMMDLGILPSMARIFSIDFLGEPSSKSYTLAGAFVRWLVSQHGAVTLRRWYAGDDVTRLTGMDWSELDAAFREDLARARLSPDALAYAKAKFDRPGVFGRRCPHVVDALRREADRCREAFKIDRAVALYGDVLARDPHDNAAHLGRGVVNARFGDEERGRRELADLAAAADTPRTYKDRSEEALADLDLVEGRFVEARARYEALAAHALDEDVGRTLEVKAYAAGTPDGRDAVARLLVGASRRPADTVESAAQLAAWAEATHDPVAEYVLGKNLAQRDWFDEAAVHLDRALTVPPRTPRIGREILRQRAICACAGGDPPTLAWVKEKALAPDSPFAGSSGGRLEALERLIARCEAHVGPRH